MKKFIPFGTICILACVVFSSCSSSFEITKRRYNKGYYVDRSGNKDMTFITKEKATQAKITSPTYPTQLLAVQKTKANGSILMPAKQNRVSVARAEKQGHKIVIAANSSQIVNSVPATEVPSVQMVSTISGLNNITDDGDHHSRRDALSLFWLIILIVLIVWAIGLIAGGWGLGGFINILLVIALILLILWLLRII